MCGNSLKSSFRWTPKTKKNGCELEEFMAHHFLESLGETLTVLELRAKLRKIDLDANGKCALLEYLVFRFGKTVTAAVHNPQGGGPEYDAQMAAAARQLDDVNNSLAALQKESESLKEALANERKALGEQNKALEAQRIAASEVKKAEDALRVAVQQLQTLESAHRKAIAEQEGKKNDEKLSAMKRAHAATELAALQQKDPLPLNTAKLTQGAALKRTERERKAAEEATLKCAEKAKALEEQTKRVEAQKLKVEADTVIAQGKVEQALAALEAMKRQGGVAKGAIWWMEREVVEAQKYLPQSRQTAIAKK